MTHYYAITWNLSIRDLGMCKGFDEAQEADELTTNGNGDEALYICTGTDLRDLRKAIDLILS